MGDVQATAAGGHVLDALAAEMRVNSEHWFPDTHDGPVPLSVFYALGLSGEVGEVANVVKKMVRDGDTDEKRADLGSELADCFVYLLLLADEVGVDLVAEYREKVLVNMARWGSRHGNYTWDTVPIGYYVHGSGTLVEKVPHTDSGYHVTFERITPFEERWSRFVIGNELVPVGIGRHGLAYAPRRLTATKATVAAASATDAARLDEHVATTSEVLDTAESKVPELMKALEDSVNAAKAARKAHAAASADLPRWKVHPHPDEPLMTANPAARGDQ